LRRSDYRPTPQEEVALLYMEERIEAGRRTADERLAASPRDPSWAFLACAGAALFDGRADLPRWFGPRASADAALLFRGSDTRNAKDPRDALIVFLLSRKAEWAPWLLPRNKVLSRDTGSTIWSSWLSLRIHEARGDGKTVEEIVSSLTESHREFGPAHDIAVRIAEEAFPSQPLSREIVRARRMRLESLGPDLIDDPVEIALAEAGELHRRKRYGEAAQTIRTVLEAGGFPTDQGTTLYQANPEGCESCRYKGYQGRLAIYELCLITPALEELIVQRAPIQDLRSQAEADGFSPMRDYGWRKVKEGLTTVEEIAFATAQ
ncbi:MAG: hypothetical protein AAF191_07445, partial [Verrucomicrobiota bacterium]